MTEVTDAELVTRVRGGDREAYGDLVSRYQGHVYGLAYSLVGNWAEAQDVAQETFVRAYTNLDQLHDPARFAAWLRRVTFGVTMNWLRSFRPDLFEQLDGRADLEALEIPDFQPGPSEVVERKELAEVVLRAVSSLPPKYRVPLTMFHLDGLSYEKVASFLDIPLGTAKSLIHRARAKLKEALGSYYGEEVTPAVQEVFNEHKLRPGFAARVLQASALATYPPEYRVQVEGTPIPGVLRALMEFIGEDFGYYLSESHGITWRSNAVFELFTGVWGDAFDFVWLPKEGAGESVGADEGDTAERLVAVLDAAGFDGEVILKPDPRWRIEATGDSDEAALRQRIVSSIADRGWPVTALHLPARGWASLITGFRDDGKVLVGWSVEGGDDRGIRFEPEKRTEFTDWYSHATHLVLLTRRRERAPAREVYRKALSQGLRLLRRRESGDYHAGLGTFDAWARLLEDASLSAGDPATAARRQRILDPMIWDLATRRHYGRLFLQTAASVLPEGEADLLAAAACLAREHDLMWEVNALAGGRWPGEVLPSLGDPEVRGKIAALLLHARDLDVKAAKHMEAVLAASK